MKCRIVRYLIWDFTVYKSTHLEFTCHQHILQRAVRTSLEKQLDPMGPIAYQGVSIPEFLRKSK